MTLLGVHKRTRRTCERPEFVNQQEERVWTKADQWDGQSEKHFTNVVIYTEYLWIYETKEEFLEDGKSHKLNELS